jgi:hypothetical protein
LLRTPCESSLGAAIFRLKKRDILKSPADQQVISRFPCRLSNLTYTKTISKQINAVPQVETQQHP